MGRIYSVVLTVHAKSAPMDVFGIYAGDIALRIRGFNIASNNASSVTDLDLQMYRFYGSVTEGSGGGVITPVPTTRTEQAASFVAHTGDTTQGGSATYDTWLFAGVDVAEGYTHHPPVEECLVINPGEACIVTSGETITPDILGYITIEELS